MLLIVCLALTGAGAASAAGLVGSAKIGVQADPVSATAFCSTIRESGSDAMVITASRPAIDKGGGVYNFTSLDSGIDRERACGVQSGIRVFGQRNSETRAFPADPDGYAAFITALAGHEAARDIGIHRYAIENEVEVASHWEDTPQHYFDLLRIAHTAAHAGDPNAIVLDSTLSVAGLYTVRVNQLYATGRRAEALTLYRLMLVNVLGGENPSAQAIDTEDELGAYLASAKPQGILEFYRLMLANQDSFDAFQLHFYGPADRLPELVGMLRAAGMTKSIETWELGHRYRDGRPFTESGWADEVSRLIITAAGEGSRFTILQLLVDRLEDNMEYGLTTTAGTHHESFYSFRTAARLLWGATDTRPLHLPGGAVGYRFGRPSGPLFAFWSLAGSPRVGGRLGIGASTAALTGSEGTRPRQVRVRTLAATPAPRFVEPDLLQIRRLAGRNGRPRFQLTCPSASPFPRCTGTLRINGRSGRRRVRLSALHYRIARGRQSTRSIRLRRRGRPVLAFADGRPCPGGLKPCRSWLRLRPAKRPL